MSDQRRAQSVSARPQQAPRALHAPHQAPDLGPWLDEPEAIAYAKYRGSVNGFRKVCRRMGINYGKFGRSRRYRQGLLDWAMEQARWTRRSRRRIEGVA